MTKTNAVLVIALATICICILAAFYIFLQPSSNVLYLIESHQKLDLASGKKTIVFVWGFNETNVNIKQVDITYKDSDDEVYWNPPINSVFETGDNLTLVVPIDNLTLATDGLWTFAFRFSQGSMIIHLSV